MKTLKIKTTAYTYLSNVDFPQYFIDVTSAIISHPDVFNNIPIEPQVLVDAGKAMMEKTGRAVRGGELDRNARDQQRAICENYLNQLGNIVLTRASLEPSEEQQSAVLSLSKFTPVKLMRTRQSIPLGTGVEKVNAAPTGKTGQINVRWKRIRSGVLLYEVQKAFSNPAGNDTIWQNAGATSRSSITLDGFPELSRSWVRVIAHGYNGAVSIPSNPTMCVAL